MPSEMAPKKQTKERLSSKIRKKLAVNFIKCVKGYHLINDSPIKETLWEDINAIILNASGCYVDSSSDGSHKSGGDISCTIGNLSNKSTKYNADNNSYYISSYRLTTVCNDKNPGKIKKIIEEINDRKDFHYYSIIVRKEKKKQILYDWYMIPSDFSALDPKSYKWRPKLGKNGKKKGDIIGWQTNVLNGSKMSITFSMSSQLWIDLHITKEIKKFIIGSCSVNRDKNYNYIDLYDQSHHQVLIKK